MATNIDNPKYNDNRDYDYDKTDFYCRAEFPIINDLIKSGTNIIDLGCGNGSLMHYILERQKVNITGLDNSSSGVAFCAQHNLPAQLGEIDREETYKKYSDNQFDYAICNVTLQMVMYPEVLLREMRRISKYQIISVPNFAYLVNRLDLLLNGVMPRSMLYGYAWYNTGHIHQLSLRDFKIFCKNNGLKILSIWHLGRLAWLRRIAPNYLSRESIFLCTKK